MSATIRSAGKLLYAAPPHLHLVIPCGVLGGALEYGNYADTANEEGFNTLEVECTIHTTQPRSDDIVLRLRD